MKHRNGLKPWCLNSDARLPPLPQFNMFALWSFGHVAGRELGRDQFLAFYVMAGVVASLASHLATVGTHPYIYRT